MDTINFIRLMKMKLFAPRKKITVDNLGNKTLIDLNSSIPSIDLNEEDRMYLSLSEGWNVADKDYVDFRVNEMYKKVLVNNSNIPSAPSLQSLQTPVNKNIFWSIGSQEDNVVFFFKPGILFKKNYKITEFTIISDNEINDCELLMNSSEKIGKIKGGNNKVVTAECKYLITTTQSVTFSIKINNKQPIDNKQFSLQLCVEI